MADTVSDTAVDMAKKLPAVMEYLAAAAGSEDLARAAGILDDLAESKLVDWLVDVLTALRTDEVTYDTGGLVVEGDITIVD